MLRKVFCILLAVCLSVPLACPALAADTPDVVEMPAVVTPLQKEPAAEAELPVRAVCPAAARAQGTVLIRKHGLPSLIVFP